MFGQNPSGKPDRADSPNLQWLKNYEWFSERVRAASFSDVSKRNARFAAKEKRNGKCRALVFSPRNGTSEEESNRENEFEKNHPGRYFDISERETIFLAKNPLISQYLPEAKLTCHAIHCYDISQKIFTLRVRRSLPLYNSWCFRFLRFPFLGMKWRCQKWLEVVMFYFEVNLHATENCILLTITAEASSALKACSIFLSRSSLTKGGLKIKFSSSQNSRVKGFQNIFFFFVIKTWVGANTISYLILWL